jgi:hypothetical protein
MFNGELGALDERTEIEAVCSLSEKLENAETL